MATSKYPHLFIVRAYYGREDGVAIINALNKRHAKKIAKDNWLKFSDRAVISGVNTIEEEARENEIDPKEYLKDIEERKFSELGFEKFIEIDWGN